MKDAVKDSSFSRDDDIAARNERQEPAPKSEPTRVEAKENSPAQEVKVSGEENPTSQDIEESGYGGYQESTATQENKVQNKTTSAPETETKTVEPLKDLNLSPEKVDALLALFNLEPTALPSVQQQQLLSQLKGQGGQAVNLLVQAGLTEQEAKNLLTKLQSAQGNQASLQSAEETADEVLVKLNGERSASGKADFLSQFSDLNKQQEQPQRQASIEKVLSQVAKEPATDLSQKPLEKVLATSAQKLDDAFQPANNPNNPATTLNSANPLSKSNEGLKAPFDAKVQSVNAVSESAAKPADFAKSISSETLSARGTTEAKVINQILNKFSLRTNGSQSDIKIKLDPPSLGTIRMNISTSGESVRTVVIAENQAVKQIIENNLTQLRDSMGGQGLKVDSFTVLVGGNDSQSGQQNKPHEGFSHYAGLPFGENSTAPESFGDSSEQRALRLFLNDSQSISVIA